MNTIFSCFLAGTVASILIWGLRTLPRENMQILATIPWRRLESGLWRGINLTWYGVMQTAAALLAIALALVLASSARVPVQATAMTIGITLALAMPAARLVARLVERRSGTFTVGGAVFVATLLLPWLARMMDALWKTDHALPLLSALAVAYPLGEGVGRLACISFGCCYGRPIDHCRPTWRRIFGKHAAVVLGRTRKAAYASGYEGIPLVPAPAMSAIVLTSAGVAGVPLFLDGHFRTAAAVALTMAFAWRFGSELLRADYRGQGRLSPYQWMALACLAHWLPILATFPASLRTPDVRLGLPVLRSPLVLFGLAALGFAVFVYLGVSKMTTATIRLEGPPRRHTHVTGLEPNG